MPASSKVARAPRDQRLDAAVASALDANVDRTVLGIQRLLEYITSGGNYPEISCE